MVPQATDQKRENNRANHGRVIAQASNSKHDWLVKVIPEPIRKGHVPALPEFCDRLSSKGMIKVFGQINAKDTRSSTRHVRVAGEIGIESQPVKHAGKED